MAWMVALGTALDLGSKAWAYAYLHGPAGEFAGEWWSGVFVLRWTLNTGALFGTMGGRNLVFLVLSILAVPLVGYFFWTLPRHRWLPTVALASILSGTLGNLHDRIVFQGVRDFIYVEIIDYPIFNVADIWILMGAALFAIEIIRCGREDRRRAQTPAIAPPPPAGS